MTKLIIALIIAAISFFVAFLIGSALYTRKKIGLAYLSIAATLTAGIVLGVITAKYFGI